MGIDPDDNRIMLRDAGMNEIRVHAENEVNAFGGDRALNVEG